MAGALCEEPTKGHIALLTATAVAHVGILLLSRDLGSALIFFVVYISMLYLATGKISYFLGGLLAGVIGYRTNSAAALAATPVTLILIVCVLIVLRTRERRREGLSPASR